MDLEFIGLIEGGCIGSRVIGFGLRSIGYGSLILINEIMIGFPRVGLLVWVRVWGSPRIRLSMDPKVRLRLRSGIGLRGFL